MGQANFRWRYPVRVGIFLACVFALLWLLSVAVRTVNTLNYLDAVEASRDRWQRPEDVVAPLELKPGAAVADLGSGAGYFSLKLADRVGRNGRVLAVDLRRTSLFFLRLRAILKGRWNIETRVAEERDPRLPPDAFDAVLIANTYHELRDPLPILDATFRALRPGARLVLVDRSHSDHGGGEPDDHVIALARVRDDLKRKHFEVLQADEAFIDRPGERWWLLIARKPI
jgi:SAM-dependent methyltransferase